MGPAAELIERLNPPLLVHTPSASPSRAPPPPPCNFIMQRVPSNSSCRSCRRNEKEIVARSKHSPIRQRERPARNKTCRCNFRASGPFCRTGDFTVSKIINKTVIAITQETFTFRLLSTAVSHSKKRKEKSMASFPQKLSVEYWTETPETI